MIIPKQKSKTKMSHTWKSYEKTSLGQVHVYHGAPATGEQRQEPPVLMLHHSPNSAQVYHALLPELAKDRRVLAPDTPGFGMSDKPDEAPSVEDFAGWMIELLDALELDRANVIGYHTGAMTAVEMALIAPERVGKLMIIGIPVFNQEERDAYFANPWPAQMQPDDREYVCDEWKKSLAWRGPGQTLEMVKGTLIAKLQSGDQAWWGPRAAFLYPMAERLAKVKHEILAVNAKDDLWDISSRAQPLLQREIVQAPDYGFGMLEVAEQFVASMARDFFD